MESQIEDASESEDAEKSKSEGESNVQAGGIGRIFAQMRSNE